MERTNEKLIAVTGATGQQEGVGKHGVRCSVAGPGFR